MKLTAQEEYGLRCLVQIARTREGFLSIADIAEREALTPAYVGKLMRKLRLGGLVTSVRGHQGGYSLAKPADEVDVGSVLAALGGRVFSAAFCQRYAGAQRTCVHDSNCSLRPMWRALDQAVQRVLSETRLGDLLETERDTSEHMKMRAAGGLA